MVKKEVVNLHFISTFLYVTDLFFLGLSYVVFINREYAQWFRLTTMNLMPQMRRWFCPYLFIQNSSDFKCSSATAPILWELAIGILQFTVLGKHISCHPQAVRIHMFSQEYRTNVFPFLPF